jgi:deoxyribodipyrimidine photolyase-related protein
MHGVLCFPTVSSVTLVFPHQLFSSHPALKKGRKVILSEDPLFFTQYPFHKKKLVLHRASMKWYADSLRKKGYDIEYHDTSEHKGDYLWKLWASAGVREVHYAAVTDYLLQRRITRYAQRHGIQLKEYNNPNFLCTPAYFHDYFRSRKRYFLTEFYIEQRKRLNILMHGSEPAGGHWTYDVENRKKLPRSITVPPAYRAFNREYVTEAIQYVNQNFPSHYGSTDNFHYPVTAEEARDALTQFVLERFHLYGLYQDAIAQNDSFLFHSVLTPVLNIGLIQPDEILDYVCALADQNNIPINSLEGFVRQILGWREFIRIIYEREGTHQRKANFWNHHRAIPASYWNGTTGIDPIDNVIRKASDTAYTNHIERLMVMGNFMMLCEFDPDEVYRWFMTFYIDAYDWVMVPNVYGMSQFSDGGLMSTKPYISGSNYILKMSDFTRGPWCDTWDALYWGFIDKHRTFLQKNPRMSMMVRQLEKMDAARLQQLRKTREDFLRSLS